MNNPEKQLKQQLDNNLITALTDFNNQESLKNVRIVYKLHFDQIKELLQSRNEIIAIEDIIDIDNTNSSVIMANFLLIKEINRGIKEEKILINSIL